MLTISSPWHVQETLKENVKMSLNISEWQETQRVGQNINIYKVIKWETDWGHGKLSFKH